MLAANMYANADDAAGLRRQAGPPGADDELHGLGAGYRLYRTADGWLFLAVTTDDEWRRCWAAIDRPDSPTTPLRHRRRPGRQRRRARRPSWPTRFGSAGSRVGGALRRRRRGRACGPTPPRPGLFFAHDPQMLANDFAPSATTPASAPTAGGDRRPGRRRARRLGPGVLAGEQTDELLAGSAAAPRRSRPLRAARVVASKPPPPGSEPAARRCRSAAPCRRPSALSERSESEAEPRHRLRYIRPPRAALEAPPSHGMAVPLMKPAAGEARNDSQRGDVLGLAQPADGRARHVVGRAVAPASTARGACRSARAGWRWR